MKKSTSHVKRSISIHALLFASVSAILGSGWLFASYYSYLLAGPASILAWIIGGLAVIFIAYVFAELCTTLPITGSSTRIPQYTHGSIVNFMFSWVIWLSYAALVPTEVQALIQYLSYFFTGLVKINGGLTTFGYGIAAIFMLIISAINIFSLRWLLRCNNFLTTLKIFIPVLISLILLIKLFSSGHIIHPAGNLFMPTGFHGILAAISTGGIIFAFTGFKQACELAGEAKNPSRALPIAIIGSIVLCLLIYLLLQFAFLISLEPKNLEFGWQQIILKGQNSPFTSILVQHNLNILMPILYIGAIAGPLAAALMYSGSSSRSLYGMSKNNHISSIFQKLTTQGNPVFGIILNFILGMCLFAPLPGWDKMITFLTSLMSTTYAIGPICLLALRQQMPKIERPIKLPFVTLWTFLTFYLCTLMIYWTGWNVISKLSLALFIGILVLFTHWFILKPDKRFPLNWRASIWVWPYFIGVTIISYLGNFGSGKNIISFGWDFVVIGVFCIIIVWLAIQFKLQAKETEQYIKHLNLDHFQNRIA